MCIKMKIKKGCLGRWFEGEGYKMLGIGGIVGEFLFMKMICGDKLMGDGLYL